MSRSDDPGQGDAPATPERRLAAPVDAGLAGLLAGVLARSEDAQPDADPSGSTDPDPWGGTWADGADSAVESDGPAPESMTSVADPRPDPEPLPESTSPEWETTPMWESLTLSSTPVTTPVTTDPDAGAPATAPAPVAFRWSDDTTAAATSGTEAPASDTATQPTLTLIDLDPDELVVLIDGLSRVRCRPGEDGLPFAVIHLTLIGYGLNAGAGEVTRRYIQSTIRDGDIAVRMGDHAVAVLCGGLFFPGDIEVVGERIRTQVFQARQVLFNLEELTIVAAGALAAAGEDLADFLRRAGSARQHAIGTARTDVLVDYVQHAMAR